MSEMPIPFLNVLPLLAQAAPSETPAVPEYLTIQMVVLSAGVLGVGLLLACFLKPAIGRFFGKIAAVLMMGLGMGCLVWGILAAARGDQPPTMGPLEGASYSLVIGSGAGFLTAGIVALVLACLIRVPPKDAGQVAPRTDVRP